MEIRNRLYGEPLLPLNLQLFAEEGGTDGAGAADNADSSGSGAEPAGNDSDNTPEDNADKGGDDGSENLRVQLEQMKAEMAKQKLALDAATKEAGNYRKQLKAKMTQEEIDAENKREAEEKVTQELEELRRKVSRAENTKSVMSKLSVDEETAGKIAESLSGCEDIENALLLIQKTWTAKEKALKLEYGKIPGPGAGGGTEDKEMQEALALAKELGESRAKATSSVRDQLKGLVR